MPIKKYRSSTIAPLSALIPEIVYVMCGARGETSNRLVRVLPQMKFFGFEPDEEEHKRLSASAAKGFTYFRAAVGGREERRTLYVTRNPACSSLLRPNLALYGRFKDCEPDLQIVEERPIDVVSLDSFLAVARVGNVDFLDLDTQGSELEILQGAQSSLSKSAAVLKCEVEFSPLHEGQPLFGDVDRFLQRFGFMLFDLSRSRYRRATFPPHALTEGSCFGAMRSTCAITHGSPVGARRCRCLSWRCSLLTWDFTIMRWRPSICFSRAKRGN
jgi:FkbM family methyltransferase